MLYRIFILLMIMFLSGTSCVSSFKNSSPSKLSRALASSNYKYSCENIGKEFNQIRADNGSKNQAEAGIFKSVKQTLFDPLKSMYYKMNRGYCRLRQQSLTECGQEIIKDETVWEDKIQELSEQTICNTGTPNECYEIHKRADSEKRGGYLKYAPGTALMLSSRYIHRAIFKPNIKFLLPPNPDKVQGVFTSRSSATSQAEVTIAESVQDAESIKAFYQTRYNRDAEFANRNRITHLENLADDVESVTQTSDKIKKAQDSLRFLVYSLGENRGLSSIDTAYLQDLAKIMESNPVRLAELLTQIASVFSERSATIDVKIIDLIEEISDEELREKIFTNGVANSHLKPNSKLSSDEFMHLSSTVDMDPKTVSATGFMGNAVKSVEDLTPEQLIEFKVSEYMKQQRLIKYKLERYTQQIGRIVNAKGFANLKGAKQFYSYYYYRRMLSAWRALNEFQGKIKSPFLITESAGVFAHFGQGPASIPTGYGGLISKSQTVSTVVKDLMLSAKDAETTKKLTQAVAASEYVFKTFRDPKILSHVNGKLSKFGEELLKLKAFNVESGVMVFKSITSSFVQWTSTMKPTDGATSILKLVGDIAQGLQSYLDKDELKLLASKLGTTPAVERMYSKLGKKIGQYALASVGLGVNILLVLADYELYYMIGCSFDNHMGRRYQDFYYNDCSNIAGHYEDREESNIFAEKLSSFTNLSDDYDEKLSMQNEILSKSKRVCTYFTRAYKNLIEDVKVDCINYANDQAEDDNQFTHAYIGKVRFNLLMSPDNGEPSGIESKSLVRRNDKLVLKSRSVWEMSDLGVESYERKTIANNKTVLVEEVMNPKRITQNNRSIENMDHLFKMKTVMRSLIRHHYCCSGELINESCPEDLQCNPVTCSGK